MYAVRSSSGRVVARFATQYEAAAFVRAQRSPVEREDDEPVARAKARFVQLLDLLTWPTENLGGREGARAKEILVELTKLWSGGRLHTARTWESEDERFYSVTRVWLDELERLLAGQRQLFSPSSRPPASEHRRGVAKVFRQLRAIVAALPRIVENEKFTGHVHPSIEYRSRNTGLKPGAKPTRPAAKRKSAPKKAPRTFVQARDHVLVVLGRKGWYLSPPLKVPYAEKDDVRLWFRPQAVWASSGLNRTKMGEARSVYNEDYRFLDPAAVADTLERIAERARRR